MKNLVFISHASPEDNNVAAWLAAKLKLAGYETWVDIKNLKTGDSFWPEIENKIRNESVRFIMLITSNYIRKAKIPQTGVRKEIACANAVRDIERFIYPVRFDKSEFSEFAIDFIDLNTNDFFENWAIGLNKLLDEFREDEIPRKNELINPLSVWHLSRDIETSPINKKEKYYSNWLDIELPEKIFVHIPKSFKFNNLSDLPFVFIRNGNMILCFSDGLEYEEKFIASFEYKLEDFYSSEEIIIDENNRIKDPTTRLISLLNKVMKNFLSFRKLSKYKLSGRKEAYYFPYHNNNNNNFINLSHLGRTRKKIVGVQRNIIWQYAISVAASLNPIPHFKLFNHLIFSDIEGKPLSKNEQVTYRRNIPSDWYNRDWLDLLLAFITKLKDNTDDNQINLREVSGSNIYISTTPILFFSNVGYNESEN